MSNKHIMLDIETLATSSDAAIVSIGGCVFSLEDDAPLAGTVEGDSFIVSVNRDFYLELDVNDEYCVDPSTVAWWDTQGPEAKESLCINQVVTPGEALDKMDEFFQHHAFEKTFNFTGDRVWANPASFDFVILKNAAGIERSSTDAVPWHFRQETCMRTVFWMHNDQPRRDRDIDLVAHRADHDAIAQARALQDFHSRDLV